MKTQQEQSTEQTDAAWELVKHASHKKPSAQFTNDVLRAARQESQTRHFFSKWLVLSAPAVAVAACICLALWVSFSSSNQQQGSPLTVQSKELWEQLHQEAEIEVLIAAPDILDDFSDEELIAFAEM